MAKAPYKLPGRVGRHDLPWGGVLVALAIVVLASGAATQYVAARLGYHADLGAGWLALGDARLYAPYDWLVWFARYIGVDDPALKDVLLNASMIAAFGLLAGIVAVPVATFVQRGRRKSGDEHLHGSARWANEQEIRASGLLGAKQGVYVGAWQHPKRKSIHYLRHNGPEHVLAFAPTRSGKGVGLVLPTLLSWPASVIVYDIKGENWALTAGWRAQEAENLCIRFAPTESDSACFNPLEEIRLGTPRDVSDAQNIADIIVRPNGAASGGGDNEHWVNAAFSLLTGVILHVCYRAQAESRHAGLAEVAGTLTQPGQTLEETLQEMMFTAHDPGGRYGWRDAAGAPTQVHPVVAEKAQEMLDKEDKERSGVLSTAKTILALYSDPVVSRNIARSDFRIADLMNLDQPVSLYIVVPPSDQERLRPLTRLLFTQIVSRLTEKMEFADGRSVAQYKHRLLLLIDEFPTLGKLDVFAKSLAFIAGYGLKAYLITQDLTQIQDAYGEKESVVSNCHIRIAYAPNKIETAEMLSKMTGTATVLRETTSYSGGRSSAMLGQVSRNVEAVERPLLTPDECMRLPGPRKDKNGNVTQAGDMLIFVAGQNPIYGKQILYFQDPTFAERAKIAAPETDRPRDRARAAAAAATAPSGGITPRAKEPERVEAQAKHAARRDESELLTHAPARVPAVRAPQRPARSDQSGDASMLPEIERDSTRHVRAPRLERR